MVQRALISVSDKTGVIDFARGLSEMGFVILSTGGTYKTLNEAKIENILPVEAFTGLPEMFEGRVKTLHPKVHGGILYRRGHAEDEAQAEKNGIPNIDLVVVNLYPFAATVAKPEVTLEEAIENIDIGGPAMIRSAAKNHAFVTVVVDPADYSAVLEKLRANNGETTLETRQRLAIKAFGHTANYDAMIGQYFYDQYGNGEMPEIFPTPVVLRHTLRYGENPHQAAALYESAGGARGLASVDPFQGKPMSFNNYLDANAALEGVRAFEEPTAFIVKHLSPCGVASADTLEWAYLDALGCDPLSAFGGIVGFNHQVDGDTARALLEGMERYGFLECILAPGFDDAAKEALKAKPNLRLLELPREEWSLPPFDAKAIHGGLLVQQTNTVVRPESLKVVTEVSPTEEQITALLWAWRVCTFVKSNAIVYAKKSCYGFRTIGIGGGLYSRIDSHNLAAEKAGRQAVGAVMASDAFFPQRDNVERAKEAGIAAIIQPGGSIKDQESIDACNRYGIAMVFTGVRCFKH